ncbi:MAG: hypothetical protein PHU65_01235 [Actinomycetota bacterium]|nr:hypothetical protein [Actinomycetota bacterium]
MSALLIFSFILFLFHIFSLRAIFKSGNKEITSNNTKMMEEIKNEVNEEKKGIPVAFTLPIIIIIILSLIELGYYFFAVYVLNDNIIIAGASILAGFNIYSLIKFFPRIKKFIHKPFDYLKEKTEPFENIINAIMAILEILFCLYVIIKIILRTNL